MDLDRARARRWWAGRPKITRIDRAAAFVEDLGFCLLFPNQSVALPSLYDAASDRPLFSPAGDWGPDADRVWDWKDELPRRGLAWYGRFLRGRPSLLAPSLLGDLYPRRGRPDDFDEQELPPPAHRIARILLRSGPQSTAALREALDVEGRRATEGFQRALAELGRALVVTNFGTADEGGAWPVPVLELTARAFRIPPPGRRSRLRAAARFVDTMVAATPAELASAFRLDLEESRDLLETLVRRGRAARDEAGRYVAPAGRASRTRSRTSRARRGFDASSSAR